MSLPHIGIISPEFPPDIGGVENYALGYAMALVDLGYPVTVFTTPHSAGEIKVPGINVRPLLKLRRVLDRHLLNDTSIEAWHVMNAAYSWVAEDTNQNVVVSVHGNDFLKAYYPLTGPAIYRFGPLWRWTSTLRRLDNCFQNHTTHKLRHWLPKASHVLCNSRYTEAILLEAVPACRGKTTPALVGVDPYFLEMPLASKSRHQPVRLVSITRLSEPRKNIDRVLHALAQLKDSFHFQYTVIGDGATRPHLENLVSQLGLQNHVVFTGSLNRQDLRDSLRQSDLFILSSSILPGSHEGFGLVYLEAAACGVPSLACRQAGAGEAVAENTSGLFVEQPEIADISAALKSFLAGDIQFKRDDCRHFAQQFSWQRVVEKALPFYH